MTRALSTFHTILGNLLKRSMSSSLLLSQWLEPTGQNNCYKKMPQKWNTEYECSPRSVTSAFDFLQSADYGFFSIHYSRRCFVFPSVVYLRHSMLEHTVPFNVARFLFFCFTFCFQLRFQRNNSFESFSRFCSEAIIIKYWMEAFLLCSAGFWCRNEKVRITFSVSE